jgi:plasmid maintenance system antidote protein VapI
MESDPTYPGRDQVAPAAGLPSAAPRSAGLLVRQFRQAAGLTQVRLAEAIDRDVKTVNSLECERSQLTWEMANLVGPVLGQAPEALMAAHFAHKRWRDAHAAGKPRARLRGRKHTEGRPESAS